MHSITTRFTPVLFATALLLLLPAQAQADPWTVQTGNASIDRDGFGNAQTLGGRAELIGLNLALASVALEAELSGTIDEGNVRGGNDWNLQSGGAFGTVRTAGPLYLIGRAGLTRQRVSVSGGPTDYATQEAFGLGAGIGIGVMQLELVAHQYGSEDNVDEITWVTLGLRF